MKKTDLKFIGKDIEKDIKLYDIDEWYIDYYKKNPKALMDFKELLTKEFNETGDIAVLLSGLKLIAIVEKKISLIAKKANVDRTSVYRMLSKNANPSFNAIKIFSDNLGISFNLSVK